MLVISPEISAAEQLGDDGDGKPGSGILRLLKGLLRWGTISDRFYVAESNESPSGSQIWQRKFTIDR